MAPYLQNYLDLLLKAALFTKLLRIVTNSKQYYTHTYFKAETF